MTHQNQIVLILMGLLLMAGDRAPLWGEALPVDNFSLRLRQISFRQAVSRARDEQRHQAHAFVLRDQFDRMHTYRFPRSQVSVLIMADRRGSRQLKAWLQPIYERFGKQIDLAGVADLAIVPRFARGFVRRLMRHQLSYPVMLDWTGDVIQHYDYQKGQANLFVIDQNGYIVLTHTGAATTVALQRMLTGIAHMLTGVTHRQQDKTPPPIANPEEDERR